MARNQNVNVRQLRQELRKAGWTPHDQLVKGEEVWWPPGSAREGERVRFQVQRDEVGPGTLFRIRKAIERYQTIPLEMDSPPGSRETILDGPAVPEEGAVFYAAPGFDPSIPEGTVVVVTAILGSSVVVVDLPTLGRRDIAVVRWAATVTPFEVDDGGGPLAPGTEDLEAQTEDLDPIDLEDLDTLTPDPEPAPAPLKARIREWLSSHPPSTCRDIATGIGGRFESVKNAIAELQRAGVVRVAGEVTFSHSTGGTRAYRYGLVPEGAGSVQAPPPRRDETSDAVPSSICEALGLPLGSAPDNVAAMVRKLRAQIAEVLDAAREGGYPRTQPIGEVVPWLTAAIDQARTEAREAERRAQVQAQLLADVDAELLELRVPSSSDGPRGRIRRLAQRFGKVEEAALRNDLVVARGEIVRLQAEIEQARAAAAIPTAPASAGAIPNWSDDQIADLVRRLGMIDVLRWHLRRKPTREDLLAAALGALEDRLKGSP
jgi:hypothetical protein